METVKGTERNPYTVKWYDAPEWAQIHVYEKNGQGYWHGLKLHEINNYWIPITRPSSNYLTSEDLQHHEFTYQFSLTRRPI